MSPEKNLSKLDTALLSAIETSDTKAVASALKAGANPNARNPEGYTALHNAAAKASAEIVELLLEHGAQVNAVGRWGMTALMHAIQCGNAPLVERLIAKGADVHHATEDEEGNTPLTLALNLDELHDEPSADVLGLLLRAGANPNTPNARGWAPLHFAACLEDVKLTELLLQAGADARRPHANGNYPIDTASHRGHTNVVKRLLAAGSPTLEQVAAERMEGIWKRIGAWYAQNHPAYAENLERTRPATPAKVAALEEALETELPADFRAFLLRFGGGASSDRGMSIAEYDVLSVEQILSRWKGLGKLREEGTFADAMPHELSEEQKQVAWTWWHPGWIPFAQDGGGNLYCVDLAPGPQGERGQVIGWEMHGGPLRPRAASLDAFFDAYLEKLTDGRLQLPDDE